VIHPLLKPCQMKRRPIPVVEVRPDGKEICADTPRGREEYRLRTLKMFDRQCGICRWCGLPMFYSDASFDHENGRTKGNQDDRIEVDGVPQNAAVHYQCNAERGSSRILTRVEWLAWKANKYEPILDDSEIQLIRDCGYQYPP
jgi:hypothetical protein